MSLKNDLLLAFRFWAEKRGIAPEICFELSQSDGVPLWVAGDSEAIVINIGDEAVKNFISEDDVWFFSARFSSEVVDIKVQVSNIRWIRGRETPFYLNYPEDMDEIESLMFKKEPHVKTDKPTITVIK